MQNSSHFYIALNTKEDIRETINKDITSALKTLITLESQKTPTSKYIVSIITNLTRDSTNTTFLTKKLFYYYITLIPKLDNSGAILAEVLLITNMLRKDLQSPNEYLRVVAMRALRSFPQTENIKELMINFYKPLKENLKHKNAYVRRNAIQILKEVFGESSTDMMLIERDDMVLRQLCITNEKYDVCINTDEMGVNLLEILVNQSEDYEFIYKVKNKLPYECCKKLVMNDIHTDECLDELLRCERKVDGLKFLVNERPEFLRQKISLVIDILREDESLICYGDLLRILLQEENKDVFGFVDEILKSGTTKNVIYTLKSLHDTNYQIDIDMINSENPEISYEALKLLSDKGIMDKINIEKIRYGKILRKAMQIINDEIKRSPGESHLRIEKYCKIFERTLDTRKTREYFLDKVFEDETPFIGISVGTFFENLGYLMDDTLRARSIAILLRYIKRGNECNKIDMSTENTMTLCIRSLIAGKEKNQNDSPDPVYNGQKSVVKKGCPLELIPFEKTNILTQVHVRQCKSSYVKDLTALSDPVFVQGSVKVNNSVLSLMLTFTNLTNTLLQNLDIDLTTSANLYPLSDESLSFLGPNQTIKATYTFSINKIAPMFICGVLVFNYMSERKEFNKIFHLNLDEIVLGIREFLVKGGSVDFESLWHTFEWENIYSVKLQTKSVGLRNLLYFVADKMQARIIVEQGDDNYLVANMVIRTILNDSILINVLLCVDDSVCAEFRIRSRSEDVVKGMSCLIAEYVKKLSK